MAEHCTTSHDEEKCRHSSTDNKSLDLQTFESEPQASGSVSGSVSGPMSFKPSSRTVLIMCCLMILSLISALDATSISVALPDIAIELNGTSVQIVWAGSSFLLTSAVFQPLIASLSEIFGRRPVIMVVVILFGLGGVLGATAQSFTVLIVARSIQGVGGGGIMVLTEMVIVDLIPLRQRGLYFSFLAAMWSVGTVVGPILGGVFTSRVSWRWIFYINLPFCGIVLVMIPFVLKLHMEPSTFRQKIAMIDFPGVVLFTCSCTSLLLGVISGGITYPWKSPQIIVPIVLGGLGLFLFVFHQLFIAKNPMIRPRVFQHPAAMAGYLQIVLHGLILWCLLFYLPLYYQAVRSYSAINSGIALLPETLICAPAAIISGVAITVWKKYAAINWLAWAFTALGSGVLLLLRVDSSVGLNIVLNIPISIGSGILFSSLNLVVMTPNSNDDAPYAASMLTFLRVVGQCFGVAIGGSVFANELLNEVKSDPSMWGSISASASGSMAMEMVEYIESISAGETKLSGHLAIMESLKVVFYVAMGFSLLGFVLNVFIRDLPLDRTHHSRQYAD